MLWMIPQDTGRVHAKTARTADVKHKSADVCQLCGVSCSQLRPDVTLSRPACVHLRGFMRKYSLRHFRKRSRRECRTPHLRVRHALGMRAAQSFGVTMIMKASAWFCLPRRRASSMYSNLQEWARETFFEGGPTSACLPFCRVMEALGVHVGMLELLREAH